MSFSRDKSKGRQKGIRAIADSGESFSFSDSDGAEDDDLDIINASRKGLDLSQYIDGQSMRPRPLTMC